MALRVVFVYASRDVVEDRGLARAGRCHDQPSLPFPDGAEEVHYPVGHATVFCLEPQLLARCEGREIRKTRGHSTGFDREPIDLFDVADLRIGIAVVVLGETFDPASLLEFESANQFLGDKRVGVAGFPVAFGVK